MLGWPPVMPAASRAWVTPELEMLRETARRFFERECVPHERAWAAQHHAERSVWRQAGAAGLLLASIPETYGGGGGSFLHEAVICEEQADAQVYGFNNNVHSGIVAHYLLAYGTETQRRKWLPRMATGELVGAIAMSEPGAGSDLQGIRTTATLDGSHYRVRGAKTFISNGYHAGLVLLAVKTGVAARSRAVSLLVVETDGLDGFRRGRLLDKMGQKSQDTAELFFDDARVPAGNLLGGEEGRGFDQILQQLPQERLLIAVGAVAMMHRAIRETLTYVKGREAFGKPLMAMQNTRFRLAECQTKATVARRFVDDCIMRLGRGELDVPTAAMAKWWTTQANCEVIDECLQLHGGYGYMMEYPIGRMYADVRVSKIYGGTNEIMKEIIARAMERN